jgi:proteasome accessory factor C
MPEFSAPLKEVARMLDLVPYLSTHSFISLKQLAEEFQISEKEIAKELTTLSMCGLPGYTPYELIEVFFESGFVTINNHDALDIPRALSFTEIATLLLGLELLRDSLEGELPGISTEISTLIELLSHLSGGSIAAESDSTIQTTVVLTRAIESGTALSISYHSTSKDQISIRSVEPLEIIDSDGQKYLSAYCRLAQGFRRFRLDRIEVIEPLGEVSRRSESKIIGSVDPVVADIQITGNRRAISEELGIKELHASGRAALPIFSTDWLLRNAIAASPQVEVLADQSIRSDIRLTATRMLALYS